ncbi:MAG: hypothetical protein ACMXX9_03445 [Candidatus Woesearchaeota archaeon]
MVLNKKGFVFTSIVIVFSIILLTLFLFANRTPINELLSVEETKIRNTNQFISQSDNYISNILTVTGTNAIIETISASISSESFIEDYDTELISCLIDKEFNHLGTVVSCSDDSYLTERLNVWKELLDKYFNIDIEIHQRNLFLRQTTAWHIDLVLEYDFIVSDGFANWNISRTSVGRIPIEGMPDLVYEINIHDDVEDFQFSNNITRGGRAQGQWREIPSDLNTLVVNGTYFAHPAGVSFLNRLRGNYTPGPRGIISIVEPNKTGIYDGVIHIDTYFWSQTCNSSIPLVKYNFSNSDFIQDGLAGIFEGEGLDGAILPEIIANFTNMSNTTYISTISCP